MLIKDNEITVDLKRQSLENKADICFNEIDTNTSILKVTILDAGIRTDLTNCEVYFTCTKGMAGRVTEHASIINAQQGEVSIKLPKAALTLKGRRHASIVVHENVDGETRVAGCSEFIFNVTNTTIPSNKDIRKGDEYPVIDALIEDVKGVAIDINNSKEELKEVLLQTDEFLSNAILAEGNRDASEEDRLATFTKLLADYEEIRCNYDSEKIRIYNEQGRASAEMNRIQDEAERREAELKRELNNTNREERIDKLESDYAERKIEMNQFSKDETTRQSSESDRIANEEVRMTNEIARIANEEERNSKEDIRRKSETVRTSAEIARENSEVEREAQEQARRAAETNRHRDELDRDNSEDVRKKQEALRVEKERTRESQELIRRSNEERRVANESNRESMDNIRQEGEDRRDRQEETRKAQEITRQKNETERTKSEIVRENQEKSRMTNENNRVVEENYRDSQEKTRISQEEARQLNEANRVGLVDNMKTEYTELRDSMQGSFEDMNREETGRRSAETVRVSQEGSRVENETVRRTEEGRRVNAESLRESNESIRGQQEAIRQGNEQGRVDAETDRVSAENSRKSAETSRVSTEADRVSAENSRKSAETNRSTEETRRVAAEDSRKAAEVIRENNETARVQSFSGIEQTFNTKVEEVDLAINAIPDKSELIGPQGAKGDKGDKGAKGDKGDKGDIGLTPSITHLEKQISDKSTELDTKYNALTAQQQQDAEVIDSRDGEVSLPARLERDLKSGKLHFETVEGSNISTDSEDGYLKNVEIKGNTIQNTNNLADIRSVGDKVEGQELYEILILSVGKNLIDKNSVVIGGINTTTGEFATDATRFRTDYIKFLPNQPYFTTNVDGICFYDKDKKFIRFDRSYNGTSPSNCVYVATRMLNTTTDWQLEQGTQATPYEPYQENKLTILSPVQLEKIGEVKDVLYENGDIGKSIVTEYRDFNISSVAKNVNANLYVIRVDSKHPIFSTTLFGKIYSMPSIKFTAEAEEGFQWESSSVYQVKVSMDKFDGTVGGALDYLIKSNFLVKYATTSTVKYSLPHSQQVILRTFAPKTNISILCEIEPTIKGDVPKSLGATVNTHTTQIDGLYDELDRVKKLEQSTVSTVITEKDFVNVQETTQGYFEDIELKGRTLVNPSKIKSMNKDSRTIKNISINNFTEQMYLICDISNSDSQLNYQMVTDTGIELSQGMVAESGKNGRVVFKIPQTFNNQKIVNINLILINNSMVSGVVDNILITNNPEQSYFEGLKSVGDGTDEIVVSSVNENLFDINAKYTKENCEFNIVGNGFEFTRKSGYQGVLFPLKLIKGETYSFNYNNDVGRIYLGTECKLSYASNSGTFIADHNSEYIKIFSENDGLKITCKNVTINKGTTPKPYTPHKADKKKLLYFDPVDNTWKKPILDEFSTVKKGSDGVYRYYKRGEKVVLDGSEDWSKQSNAYFHGVRLNGSKDILDKPLICNKYDYVNYKDWDNGSQKVGIAYAYGVRIKVTDIETKTLEQFKSELQTNNVTVVYQLAQEQVYECTNIDLITYANETNYHVKSGVLSPRTTLKVHSNISNIVSLLQKKVSLLENNVSNYMITQNRLMLSSRYMADSTGFKFDMQMFASKYQEYTDTDLVNLLHDNISVGKHNYHRETMETMLKFYYMSFYITQDIYKYLTDMIQYQYTEPNGSSPEGEIL